MMKHAYIIFFDRPIPGDGGIDIIAFYKEEIIVIQCKDHEKIIGVDMIRSFEGVLSRCPNQLGIFCSENGFTSPAIHRVRTSGYDIILTNKANIYLDIVQYSKNKDCDENSDESCDKSCDKKSCDSRMYFWIIISLLMMNLIITIIK